MAAVNRDILIRSVILQASFTSFLFLGAGLGDVTLAANQVLLQFLGRSPPTRSTASPSPPRRWSARCWAARPGGAAPRRARRLGVGRRRLRWCWRWPSSLSGRRSSTSWRPRPRCAPRRAAYLPWLAAAPLIGIAAWMLDGIFIGATETRRDAQRHDRVGWAVYVAACSSCPPSATTASWAALMIRNATRPPPPPPPFPLALTLDFALSRGVGAADRLSLPALAALRRGRRRAQPRAAELARLLEDRVGDRGQVGVDPLEVAQHVEMQRARLDRLRQPVAQAAEVALGWRGAPPRAAGPSRRRGRAPRRGRG